MTLASGLLRCWLLKWNLFGPTLSEISILNPNSVIEGQCYSNDKHDVLEVVKGPVCYKHSFSIFRRTYNKDSIDISRLCCPQDSSERFVDPKFGFGRTCTGIFHLPQG